MLTTDPNQNVVQVGAELNQADLISQIGRLTSALSQTTSEAEFLSALGQYAGKHGAAKIILTYFQMRSEGQLAEDVARWTPAGTEQVKMWWMDIYRVETTVLAPLWLKADERALFVDDVESDSTLDERAWSSILRDYGQSLVILPMKRAGEWQGVVTISWASKHEFGAEERYVYESLLPTLSAIAFNRQTYLQAETIQRRYEVIAKTNAALGQATNENEILEAVAALVKEYGAGWCTLNYTHYDESDQVAVLETVAMHLGSKPMALESVPGGTRRTMQTTPLWNLMLSEQPLFIEDMLTDPRTEAGPTRDNAKAARLVAFISLPLRSNNKWQGAVSFGWPGSHIFPAELREILTVITPTLTAVVANRRLLTQAVSLYLFM